MPNWLTGNAVPDTCLEIFKDFIYAAEKVLKAYYKETINETVNMDTAKPTRDDQLRILLCNAREQSRGIIKFLYALNGNSFTESSIVYGWMNRYEDSLRNIDYCIRMIEIFRETETKVNGVTLIPLKMNLTGFVG